ncbi:MAG: ATP-grasp domain-containing protein [Bacteroidota bacterium]
MISNSVVGKKLLLLGGPALVCDIVKAARAMGVYTIVTDWYPVEKSPAKIVADKHLMISTADVDTVVDLIRSESIDGVLTGFTDSTLTYYQQICELAEKSCYITKEQIDITTNKSRFKELCKIYSVPVVDEYLIDEKLLSEQIDGLKFPVIVKPVDNSGGRGISICKNIDELHEAYLNALNFSESKKVLVERYMNSNEVSIFYILRDGDIWLSGIGNRHTKHNQTGAIPLPVAYTFPSKHLKNYQTELNDKVIAMFKSLGMKNGIVFIQSFIDDSGFTFYEMGYRLTGTLEYKIFEAVSGYNPMKMMINFALTGDMGCYETLKTANPNFNQFASNITFLGKPGKIGQIIGLEDILKIQGVVDAVPSYKELDTIPQSAFGTLKQVILRVFITAATKKQLAETMERVHNSFQVLSVEGDNMLLDKFEVNELYDQI